MNIEEIEKRLEERRKRRCWFCGARSVKTCNKVMKCVYLKPEQRLEVAKLRGDSFP